MNGGLYEMKITRIRAYQVDLPLCEGSYKWSGGKAVNVFDSTVVEVETDAGVVGYGEVCPLGPFYLPAYANGVRAGIKELGPHLIGENPLELGKLNRRMDAALKGLIEARNTRKKEGEALVTREEILNRKVSVPRLSGRAAYCRELRG